MQHIPLLFVCVTIGTVSCATTPLTEAEEIKFQHEQEDRRLVRRDKLITFLNACDAHTSLVIVEKIKSGRSVLPNERQKRKAIKEYGYPYTHNNVSRWARRSDIYCMTPRDVMRQLGF